MVALVYRPSGLRGQRVDRIEFLHLDAGIDQALEELARRRERSGAVIHQRDLEALRAARDQRIGELLTDFIVFDDVGLHQNVVFCTLDRREHCLVRRRAVAQQGSPVADDEWRVGDPLLEREVTIEDARFLTACLQLVEDLLALLRAQRAARRLELDRRIRSRHVGIDHRERTAAGDDGRRNADDQRRDPGTYGRE